MEASWVSQRLTSGCGCRRYGAQCECDILENLGELESGPGLVYMREKDDGGQGEGSRCALLDMRCTHKKRDRCLGLCEHRRSSVEPSSICWRKGSATTPVHLSWRLAPSPLLRAFDARVKWASVCGRRYTETAHRLRELPAVQGEMQPVRQERLHSLSAPWSAVSIWVRQPVRKAKGQ